MCCESWSRFLILVLVVDSFNCKFASGRVSQIWKVSANSVTEMMVISTAHIVTLSVVHLLLSATKQSSACSQLYVKLGDSSAVDTSSCGTPSLPCSTIHRAISNQRQRFPTDNCTAVHLQPSKYNSPISCEVLQSLNSIIIDGASAGRIPLKLVNCSEPAANFTSSWMVLTGVKNLKLQNLDVDLENFTGCSAMYVQYSDNVTFVNSKFSNPMINTSAIFSSNNFDVIVSGCIFKGYHQQDPYFGRRIPYELPQYRLAILIIRSDCLLGSECNKSSQGRDLAPCCPATFLPTTSGDSFGLTVQHCTFRNLGIFPKLFAQVSTTHYADASALHFGVIAGMDFKGIVRNCTFHENYSPYDTVLKLYAGPGATNTKFRVEDSSFSNGRAYIGGGAYMRATETSVNTTIHIVRTVFTNNTATSQGGALGFSLARTQIEALTAYEQLEAVFIEGCTFTDNTVAGAATKIGAGGAMSIITPSFYAAVLRSRSRLPTTTIRHTVIAANTAYFSSAIFAAGANISLEDTLLLHNSGDSAVGISSSYLSLGRNVTFLKNSSPNNGGAIALYDYSALDFGQNVSVRFINNSAVLGGGAIFADVQSSTVDIADILQYTSNIGLSKPCFIQSGPDAVYSFNSSAGRNNASVVFEGNQAAAGNSIFANSFTACLDELSPILGDLDQSVPGIEYTMSPIASSPVWIAFESAGCSCLKINPENRTNYWVYDKSCSREIIFSDVKNNSLFADTSYPSLLKHYTSSIEQRFKNSVDVNGFGVFASPQIMAVPWAVSTFEWYYPRDSVEEHTKSRVTGSLLTSTYMSSVTLHPAPGQLFPLQIQNADVYFNLVYTLVQIQVAAGSALLLYNGYLYSILESILFVPTTPIIIGLAGQPGAEGSLRIVTSGQIGSAQLELIIPFRLSPCLTGFQETFFMSTATKEQVERYINTTYTKTKVDGNSSSRVNELICQCPTNVPGVQYCANGSDIIMDWTYWAGEASSASTNSISASAPLQIITNLTEYEDSLRSKIFLTSLCYSGFCTDHQHVNWNVRLESPCIATRRGPICGQCEDGYSQAIAWSPICLKCSDSGILTGQLSMIALFVYSGVALLLFSYFEVGKSAVFDSWVSFEQFCLFTIRRDIVIATATNIGYYSCFTRGVTVLDTSALLYVNPAMFFLWVPLMFQLSRFVAVRRFILNYSLVVGMWAVVTFSYGYLVYPSFRLLACHKFNGKFVLFSDASIECFSSEHWPYALLALCALLLIAIPMPVLIMALRSSPRIKPLVDVYLSFVRDDRLWFITYGMGRRILVCIVSVYTVDSTARQLSLAFLFQVFLLVHFVMLPYRQRIDNLWEAVFLGFCCVFAFVNVLPVATYPILYTLVYVAYGLPVCAAYLYGAVMKRRKVLTLLEFFLTVLLAPVLIIYYRRQKKPVRRIRFIPDPEASDGSDSHSYSQTNEQIMERAKTVYQLRDDLLVDVFQEDGSM